MTEGTVFAVKRFAVHDGDGIRTTVFLKGCPLRCVWCHNPEGLEAAPALAFYQEKCINCGACADVCNCHQVAETHTYSRENCAVCGRCAEVCPRLALEVEGRRYTVEALLPELLADRVFYETSGGGVTLSGGECLMQADFCGELLEALKKEGIHTAVDTCGFVPWAAFEKVLPCTDVFLYDLKAVDEAVHRRCTGQPNGLILENLRRLDDLGKAVEIRIPYVPGYNDGELPAMAELLQSLRCLTGVRLLPYHNYVESKYRALGIVPAMPEQIPEQEELNRAAALLKAAGLPLKT